MQRRPFLTCATAAASGLLTALIAAGALGAFSLAESIFPLLLRSQLLAQLTTTDLAGIMHPVRTTMQQRSSLRPAWPWQK